MFDIDNVIYKVCSPDNWITDMLTSKKSAHNSIYETGIEQIYCSANIYSNLCHNANSCVCGPTLFIIDARNDPRLITTAICSVTCGAATTTGTRVNGEYLTSANSATFVSVAQYHDWLRSALLSAPVTH